MTDNTPIAKAKAPPKVPSLLDSNGLQLYESRRMKAAEVLAGINRLKRKFLSDGYRVFIDQSSGDPERDTCVIQCGDCDMLLSPNNPSAATSSHSSSCKAREARLKMERGTRTSPRSKGLSNLQPARESPAGTSGAST
jgi:hypothetical protein